MLVLVADMGYFGIESVQVLGKLLWENKEYIVININEPLWRKRKCVLD